MLEAAPARLQAAFAARASGDPRSPSFASEPRHSLLPLAELPDVLAAAMPRWPAALAAYAAAQLAWHINVVSYTSESPLAAAAPLGPPGRPRDMMYAEMAASIIAAAETEAAAADAHLLPGAQGFLTAVEDTLRVQEAQSKLRRLWAACRCVHVHGLRAMPGMKASENIGPPVAADLHAWIPNCSHLDHSGVGYHGLRRRTWQNSPPHQLLTDQMHNFPTPVGLTQQLWQHCWSTARTSSVLAAASKRKRTRDRRLGWRRHWLPCWGPPTSRVLTQSCWP